jgi:hypothetical protein
MHMKIAVLGTGAVGRTLAGRLEQLGHVVIGTRHVSQTLARTEPGGSGHPSYELILNATASINSLPALDAVGAANLAGKVLLDLALPLDLSQGLPPEFTISGSDSLGERIQRSFPEARVVKALNTVFMDVMVDPSHVRGERNLFVAGDDSAAKETVTGILCKVGWPDQAVLDLGGIRAARGTEGYMQL